MTAKEECMETRDGLYGAMTIKTCTLIGGCECSSDSCCPVKG